jgi:A/G-specific adenine glycosylase
MDYGAVHLTAKKTKIKSINKQSKFEGSDREVRGWMIKQLVNSSATKTLTVQDIKTEFPKKDIEKIVASLTDEGIIIMDADRLRITG